MPMSCDTGRAIAGVAGTVADAVTFGDVADLQNTCFQFDDPLHGTGLADEGAAAEQSYSRPDQIVLKIGAQECARGVGEAGGCAW